MTTRTKIVLSSWLLSLLSVVLSFAAWAPRRGSLEPYNVFPLLGLLAFGLMWSHYISGALRAWKGLPKETLSRHFRITSAFVLFFLLAHPFMIELQLFLDGFGTPPGSFAAVYPALIDRVALLAGATALTFFLLFELHRFYGEKPWWKYVEWANVGAMVLILWHGFVLGGELNTPWFKIIWASYAVTFALSVGYTEYHKRRISHGKPNRV